jgi:hypothetical protein
MERLPPIEDVALFAHNFRTWYCSIQPKWRGSSWPLERETIAGQDWTPLLRGGCNGLLNVVICFVWWWQVLEEGDDTNEFDDVLADFAWVIERVLQATVLRGVKQPKPKELNNKNAKKLKR